MELDLVEELGAIAAHEVEESGRALARELVGAADVETPRQPSRLVGQMLQQHRPALGDRVVAEPALLHRQIRRRVREVLGVASLVEERAPVVRAADRLDHEHDLVGDLDRGAERSRGLRRPLLEVEMDVLLGVQVDPEVGTRVAQN